MERRTARIGLILITTALIVGVLPVIPVGEVLAPEHSALTSLSHPASGPSGGISPLAGASTIEKLRHLFSR